MADQNCSICMGKIINKLKLGCDHEFCKFCIQEWMKMNLMSPTCPVCRFPAYEPPKGHANKKVDCPISDCDFVVARKDLKEHVHDEHQLIECADCGESMMFHRLEIHSQIECHMAPVYCPYSCRETIPSYLFNSSAFEMKRHHNCKNVYECLKCDVPTYIIGEEKWGNHQGYHDVLERVEADGKRLGKRRRTPVGFYKV